MSAKQVYVKTPAGIEVINGRSRELTPRERRILIMADGKRSFAELAAILPDGTGADLLQGLIAGGYVVPLHPAPAAQIVPSGPVSSAPEPDALAEPILDDEQRFEMAKNFMRNTVNTFLGVMGSGLNSQLEKCASIDELRVHFGAWQKAIHLSRDGRAQAAELENRLAALLS